HNTLGTKILDLPVEPVAGRPRLIAERQPLVFGGKLLHQLGRCSPGVLDLAEKPNLAHPPGLRDRNRITQLRGIESYESFAMIAHDSPSLFEALPGRSGQPSRQHRARVASSREGTYGLRDGRYTTIAVME